MAQGMTGEIDCQCSTLLQAGNFRDNLLQRNIVVKIPINGMQTGRSTGGAIRLGDYVQEQFRLHRVYQEFWKLGSNIDKADSFYLFDRDFIDYSHFAKHWLFGK